MRAISPFNTNLFAYVPFSAGSSPYASPVLDGWGGVLGRDIRGNRDMIGRAVCHSGESRPSRPGFFCLTYLWIKIADRSNYDNGYLPQPSYHAVTFGPLGRGLMTL